MESKQKEAWFWMYCKHCVNADKTEEYDVCNECLNNPSNEDSHKPVCYVWNHVGEEPIYNSTDERKEKGTDE